jgi:hypothetical protein
MWHAWERNVYRVLVGKPEGKIPLGRPRCIDGRMLSEQILGRFALVCVGGGGGWFGFDWLRIRTGGKLL